MSNFSLAYKLTWLPRLLRPSLGGDASGFAERIGMLMATPPQKTVRLAFLGDLSSVASRVAPIVDPALRALVGSAGLVVANCESPVVRRPHAVLATRLRLRHAMNETFLADALNAIGAEPASLVLSLANNHALDQGIDGFDETLETLDRLAIRTIGVMARGLVQTVKAGPLQIGLLAFTQWRNGPAKDFAGRVAMTDDLHGWVPNSEGRHDLLCAVPHWDREFRHFPRAETRSLARFLSEHGVSLIAGHHAHVVQPAEIFGQTLVAYGLGDCLGTAWSQQPWPGRIGAMLVADVSADLATIGQVARYEIVPFMRQLREGREHLLPLDRLEGWVRAKARARIDALFGQGQPAPG